MTRIVCLRSVGLSAVLPAASSSLVLPSIPDAVAISEPYPASSREREREIIPLNNLKGFGEYYLKAVPADSQDSRRFQLCSMKQQIVQLTGSLPSNQVYGLVGLVRQNSRY